MISNFFKTAKLSALAVVLLSGYVNDILAQQSESLLNFKFNHSSNIQARNSFFQIASPVKVDVLEFAQYDATWTYPLETKNVNIDLGVTLRHLSGVKTSAENLGSNYFQQVLPLVHASALFGLPLKGLSAGIEGSHFDSDDKQFFDYRAQVSYEWRDGFGLQGGWQHQQFSLDNAVDASYKNNGAFIDFYLNF